MIIVKCVQIYQMLRIQKKKKTPHIYTHTLLKRANG